MCCGQGQSKSGRVKGAGDFDRPRKKRKTPDPFAHSFRVFYTCAAARA